MKPVYGNFKRTSAFQLVLVLSLLCLAGMNDEATGAPLRPPENIELYYKLFVNVRSLTGFPFSIFPGLGNADKTKFIADDLINRDELPHTTTYLKTQVIIRSLFSPDTVKELSAMLNVCEFLLRTFPRIASQNDAQGHPAIGEPDIERLFAPASSDKRIYKDAGIVS